MSELSMEKLDEILEDHWCNIENIKDRILNAEGAAYLYQSLLIELRDYFREVKSDEYFLE